MPQVTPKWEAGPQCGSRVPPPAHPAIPGEKKVRSNTGRRGQTLVEVDGRSLKGQGELDRVSKQQWEGSSPKVPGLN